MIPHARRLLTGCCLLFATLAYAHPGHEGHELTWDMRHLAQHPLATIGCAALVGVALALAVNALYRHAETYRQRTKK
jgi:lysylphosphatidylglycerol synthetase-like protein (DUF2156 family)